MIDPARQQWADGAKRLDGEQRDPVRHRQLWALVDVIVSELRRRIGQRFTLDELQGSCEAIAGRPLHRANFRRTVAALKHAIVEPTGEVRESEGRGVDPQLFRFREQATAGRLDVSIRMPWLPLTSSE